MSGKNSRNNKTVSLARSQTECEGRVQIKRRIGDLEVSQSDFTVFLLPFLLPPFIVSAKIFCQKVMETPLQLAFQQQSRRVGLLKGHFSLLLSYMCSLYGLLSQSQDNAFWYTTPSERSALPVYCTPHYAHLRRAPDINALCFYTCRHEGTIPITAPEAKLTLVLKVS